MIVSGGRDRESEQIKRGVGGGGIDKKQIKGKNKKYLYPFLPPDPSRARRPLCADAPPQAAPARGQVGIGDELEPEPRQEVELRRSERGDALQGRKARLEGAEGRSRTRGGSAADAAPGSAHGRVARRRSCSSFQGHDEQVIVVVVRERRCPSFDAPPLARARARGVGELVEPPGGREARGGFRLFFFFFFIGVRRKGVLFSPPSPDLLLLSLWFFLLILPCRSRARPTVGSS